MYYPHAAQPSPEDRTDTAPLDLATRRLSTRRRIIEAVCDQEKDSYPEENDTSSHADYPRSARQLTDHQEHQISPDPHEVLGTRRVIRWKTPQRIVLIIGLCIAVLWLVDLGKSFMKTAPEETIYSAGNASHSNDQFTEPSAISTGTNDTVVATGTVWVHVAGSVQNPGLYELPNQSRISQAVESAGGPTDTADLNHINLAQIIEDGQQIYIPAQGEPLPATAPLANENPQTTTSTGSSQLINLNTATAEELQTLPRIGPTTAAKIIEWRENNGKFTSVQDLDAVPGIGPTMLENLEPLVTV